MATGSSQYNFTDAAPFNGNNLYRVKSVSITGEVTYTGIANVMVVKGKPSLLVHPNPLTSNRFQLEMQNQAAGKYQLTLLSSTGQIVYAKSIVYDGITTMQPLNLPPALAKGIYQVQVKGKGEKQVIKLLCDY